MIINNLPPQSTYPAVSVIIPLYNAERYIAECLDSVLAQTFKNYEVIVVDDCSTDSSPAIVQSYIPKFSGRLKLYYMKKNSGSAPAPRNKGFICSRGEYIFFMDADDTFTETALEEMYSLAKKFNADVVYCEKYFMSSGVGQEFVKNIHLADSRIQIGNFVTEPTFISENLAERIQDMLNTRFWATPWLRFVSREMLVANEIKFPEIIGSDDVIWSFEVLCSAKRFLRVPNICYVRRMYDESFTRKGKSVYKYVHQWMDKTIRGLKFTDNFMNRFEFFHQNIAYRYAVFDYFARNDFGYIFSVCSNLQPNEVYAIFLKEFSKSLGEHDVLVSTLCTIINMQQKINAINVQKFNQFAAQAQKRIDELEAQLKKK